LKVKLEDEAEVAQKSELPPDLNLLCNLAIFQLSKPIRSITDKLEPRYTNSNELKKVLNSFLQIVHPYFSPFKDKTVFENKLTILIEVLVQGWRIMFTFYDLEGSHETYRIQELGETTGDGKKTHARG